MTILNEKKLFTAEYDGFMVFCLFLRRAGMVSRAAFLCDDFFFQKHKKGVKMTKPEKPCFGTRWPFSRTLWSYPMRPVPIDRGSIWSFNWSERRFLRFLIFGPKLSGRPKIFVHFVLSFFSVVTRFLSFGLEKSFDFRKFVLPGQHRALLEGILSRNQCLARARSPFVHVDQLVVLSGFQHRFSAE